MRNGFSLDHVPWLKDPSETHRQVLRQVSATRRYAAGEIIFAPERDPDSVFLLQSGLARIYRLSEGGMETTFGYVSDGDVFGEFVAFGDFPRESFAQAVRESAVWKIPGQTFNQVLTSQPRLVFEVARQLAERLKRIEGRVESLACRDVRARVARILLELAADFGHRDDQGRTVIDAPVTQAEIATLVGSTRQSVNASLGDLERAGIIERDGRRLLLTNRCPHSGGAEIGSGSSDRPEEAADSMG